MVRKTKDASDITYANLLAAAEQLFFEKGVAQTTLADIATQAGLTRGAIYWHFKDKTSLLKALLEQAMLPMQGMLNALDEGPQSDPMSAIRNMCVQSLVTLAQSTRQQRIFTILFHKCENVGDVAGMLGEEMRCRDEYLDRTKRLLLQAQAMGQLPADADVSLCIQLLHNFMAGTKHQWLVMQPQYSLELVAPAMVDAVLAGLKTMPPKAILAAKCAENG